MKDRMIITVTDIHGSRQYTLHQFVKSFVKWIALGVVLLIMIGGFYLHYLNQKVVQIDSKAKQLERTSQTLIDEKERLERTIDRKTQMLHSMDEQLSDIEKLVGLTPDVDETFSKRADLAKARTAKRVDQARLSAAQIAILNQKIPNGAPIRYQRISDGFGYRIHPITKKRQFHAGVDLVAKVGTPIYAPADGVVEMAQRKGNYGNFLLIAHGYGFKTAYGHLHRFAVKEGQYVTKGELIGYVGDTGKSTGPHLHYEVRYLYKWLDPAPFLHWSAKTYGDVMVQTGSMVDWSALLGQIAHEIEVANVLKNSATAHQVRMAQTKRRRKNGTVRE